jgi:uncharacterized protein (TIGR00730 family)
MKRIAVFCGSSSGNSEAMNTQVYRLGTFLASKGLSLVYGGSRAGLMGEVAKGFLDKGASVIGVIPDFLKTKEIVHTGLTELIVTKNMHDRKVIMYEESDAFLIIPGGFGTMDEFFEIATWGQLGLHSKPIAILNLDGYYNHLIDQCKVMMQAGLLKTINFEALIISADIEEIINQMVNYKPQPVPKWLNIDRI